MKSGQINGTNSHHSSFFSPSSSSSLSRSSKFPSSSSSSGAPPKSMYGYRNTLHLSGVEAAKTLVGIFFLFILINPFSPVHLNVLVFLGGLDESGPEGAIGILFLEDEEHVEAGFAPFGLFGEHLIEEFKLEGVFFSSAFSLEIEMCGGEVNFFVGNVHEMKLDEDAVFALGPFCCGMTELERCTAFGVEGYISYYYIRECTRTKIRAICQNKKKY